MWTNRRSALPETSDIVIRHKMNGSLENDLLALRKRAFHRLEKSEQVVREWHTKQGKLRNHADCEAEEHVYSWLFVPLTLWPIDVHGFMLELLKLMSKGKRLEKRLKILIDLLGPPPSSVAQDAVGGEELQVQEGKYERLIRSHHKFQAKEEKLDKNKRFREEWNAIKNSWNVSEFQNRTGVIRRRMIQERGFRADWDFDWTNEKSRFRIVFDAFCQRWDLYGMLDDSPLLLKLTINLTPHGTLIMVPRYWSFDARRDLHWKPIRELLQIHGAHREGAKMIQNRHQREKEAEAAKSLFGAATRKGLRGLGRMRFVMDALGWHPGTDMSRLQRLLKTG